LRENLSRTTARASHNDLENRLNGSNGFERMKDAIRSP